GETTRTVHEVELAETPVGEKRFVEIICAPRRSGPSQSPVEGAAIIAIDVTASASEHAALQDSERLQTEEAGRLASMLSRLEQANRQLLEANDELAQTNDDLRIANEDLLVSHEETGAAAEEIETFNEEL